MNGNDAYDEIYERLKREDEEARQKRQQESEYKHVPLFRITNFKIGEKVLDFFKEHKKGIALTTCAAIMAGMGAVALIKNSKGENYSEMPPEPTSTPITMATDTFVPPIFPDQDELSNYEIILRECTAGADELISTVQKELTGLNIKNYRINEKSDNLLQTIDTIKTKDAGGEIIVLDFNSDINFDYETDLVTLTRYKDEARGFDALACAVRTECSYVFGDTNIIRGGQQVATDGRRAATNLEKELNQSGYEDVAFLTFAPYESPNPSEFYYSNMATAIVNGILRTSTISRDERYQQYVKVTGPCDTRSQLVDDGYYVPNPDSSHLDVDATFTKATPGYLCDRRPVLNSMATTNPDSIPMDTYEVQSGDTLYGISEKLDVPIDQLNYEGDDPNYILVGDEIQYPSKNKPSPVIIKTILTDTKIANVDYDSNGGSNMTRR